MGFIGLPDEGEVPKVHIPSLLHPEWDLKQISHCSEACPNYQDTPNCSALCETFEYELRRKDSLVWWLEHPPGERECGSCSANVYTERRSLMGCNLHAFALGRSVSKKGCGPFLGRGKMLVQIPSD